VHRALYRFTPGDLGLWRPKAGRWGAMQLTTTGRRSGRPRSVILAYLEDGPDLVTVAMNGWGAAEPAWWLNLLAHPEARVDLPGGARSVRGRVADEAEHDRLWARFGELDKNFDAYAARRPSGTAVVILETRSAT
jgi:deazaflavin-dependent oxidoreductase (nitroreductase family)